MNRSRVIRSVIPSILLLVLITLSVAPVLPSNNTVMKAQAQQQQEWPWGQAQEPFPWLPYLKSLPHEEGVTLYVITRHEATIQQKTTDEFLNSQVARELGISRLVFVPAGPNLWLDYIQRGVQLGRPIDVAWGGGPTLFDLVDSHGLLEPLNPDAQPAYYAVLYETSKLPEQIAGVPTYKIGSDGYIHWIGAAISSFGFTINTSMINKYDLPTPETWKDLARPEFAKYLPEKPLVGIANPMKSTSNTRMYEIILQAYGWDEGWRILTLMAANSIIYGGSSDVRDAVIRGDIAVGITIDFYGYTAMHQSPYCKYVLPKGVSIVNADPIAIVKTTKNPVQAAAFVAWVLSEYGGQQVWLDPDINRVPINPRVFNTSAGQQRPDLESAFEEASQAQGINFNDTLAGETEAAMKLYFVATLITPHDDLQNVWAQIAKAYLNGSITKEQFDQLVKMLTDPFEFKDPLTGQNVTFTVEYARKINDQVISNPSIYNTLSREWSDAATNRYLKTYEALQQMLQQGTQGGEQGGGKAGPSPAKSRTSQIVVAIIGIVIILAIAIYLLRK